MRSSIACTLGLIILICSCARTVNRISSDKTVDLSGRWNDSDSRQTAEKMVSDLLGSEKFKGYAKDLGKKPVIMVGFIQNKTSEHIDASNYIKRIELAIFNSGLADLVETSSFRDQLREERAQQQDFSDPLFRAKWGKEKGANLMLFGEMTSEADSYRSQKIVNYQTTLFLTDVETNKRIWYGQNQIKKEIRN